MSTELIPRRPLFRVCRPEAGVRECITRRIILETLLFSLFRLYVKLCDLCFEGIRRGVPPLINRNKETGIGETIIGKKVSFTFVFNRRDKKEEIAENFDYRSSGADSLDFPVNHPMLASNNRVALFINLFINQVGAVF